MTDSAIIDIVVQTMFLSAKVVGPMLAVSMIIGFSVSLFQSVTQIQEFTLTFVPKLVGIAIVMLVGGPWMLAEIQAFTNNMFDMVPQLLDS